MIGAGGIAQTRHLPILTTLTDVVALAARDHDRLERTARQYNIEHRYSNYRELLESGEVDAVAICTPADSHVEIALAALDRGIHVFIEKPLALNLDDCDRLIARAEHASCKAMVGFNMRWHPHVKAAREMIQRKKLGELKSIRTVFTSGIRHRRNVREWRRRRVLGGGGLVELAVHQFDLWRFLLGSEVEEISVISRSSEWDDETLVISARMTNGVLVSSVIAQGSIDSYEVEIFGTADRVQLSCYRSRGLYSSAGAPSGKVMQAMKQWGQAFRLKRAGGPYLASYRNEWRHFVDCIERDIPVQSTLDDGRRALQVVLAGAVSASRGETVKIADAPSELLPVAINATRERVPAQ